MNFHGFDTYLCEEQLQGRLEELNKVSFQRMSMIKLFLSRVLFLHRNAACCRMIKPLETDLKEEGSLRISSGARQEPL